MQEFYLTDLFVTVASAHTSLAKTARYLWRQLCVLSSKRYSQRSNEGVARGAQFPGRRMAAGGAKESHKRHKYILQYSEFASERPQFRTRWHQTCFLPRAPSDVVTPLALVMFLKVLLCAFRTFPSCSIARSKRGHICFSALVPSLYTVACTERMMQMF